MLYSCHANAQIWKYNMLMVYIFEFKTTGVWWKKLNVHLDVLTGSNLYCLVLSNFLQINWFRTWLLLLSMSMYFLQHFSILLFSRSSMTFLSIPNILHEIFSYLFNQYLCSSFKPQCHTVLAYSSWGLTMVVYIPVQIFTSLIQLASFFKLYIFGITLLMVSVTCLSQVNMSLTRIPELILMCGNRHWTYLSCLKLYIPLEFSTPTYQTKPFYCFI